MFKYFLLLLVFFLAASTSFSATFVVDNTGDTDVGALYNPGDGSNTLRKCIRLANANPGADIIEFNIPGAGPYIINRVGPNPITDQVTINGFSQPGAAIGTPLIQVRSNGNTFHILNAASSGTTIRGLVINGGTMGILVENSINNIIAQNFVGTNLTGNAASATPIIAHGILALINSNNLAITDNVIGGCNTHGVLIQNSNTPTLRGNKIGIRPKWYFRSCKWCIWCFNY